MTTLGLSLLVIGAVVIVFEAHVPTMGVLGGPGVVALVAGAVLTVSGVGGGLGVVVASGLLLAVIGVGALVLSLQKGTAVRRRRIAAGPERLIGHMGVVRSWSEPTGNVLVDGALWSARHSWPDGPGGPEAQLHVGDPVVVERLSGLTLSVRRAEDWELVS